MLLVPLTLLAQTQRDLVPLKSWPAPLYFQPTRAESRELARPDTKPDTLNALSSDGTSLAATPAGSLVFVAMTPCRIADTRDGTFPAGFGPPSLTGGTSRTFAIQSPSSLCPVPSIAQAYSFNVTVVPPGTTFPGNVNPSGALGYLTIWPTGVPQPVVSTLNSFLGTVSANAAIVPAGTNGSVNVFVFNSTDVIIDINGYYAPQSGITLAQGNAGAPSLSFAGDPGTGIFSSGAGTLNIATGGTSRLSVASSGNVGVGTIDPEEAVHVSSSSTQATNVLIQNTSSSGPRMYLSNFGSTGAGLYWPGLDSANTSSLFGANLFVLRATNGLAFSGSGTAEHMRITPDGNVGIGTNPFQGKLQVDSGAQSAGIYVTNSGTGGRAVVGIGSGMGSSGVWGIGPDGIHGESITGNAVHGVSTIGFAGYFDGIVHVEGCISATNISCPSDARLKDNITPLSYGLPEILRLRPVTWQWKDATRTEPKLGFVAQDVEPVLPELIIHNADNKGALGLNYMGLVPVTINAIQQQQAQIEDQRKLISEQREAIGEQQQEIRDQKEQNRKLEERLATLEKLLSRIQPSTTDR
jgi:hypothetical protein